MLDMTSFLIGLWFGTSVGFLAVLLIPFIVHRLEIRHEAARRAEETRHEATLRADEEGRRQELLDSLRWP